MPTDDKSRATSFRAELEQCLPMLIKWCMKLARNKPAADELLQATCLRALEYEAQFKPGTNMKAWLATIARNTFLNDIRREAKRRHQSIEDMPIPPHAPSQQRARDEVRDLEPMLARLPRQQLEALMLAADGLSYEEMVVELGVPLGTVRSRVSRARAAIDVMQQEAFA